MKKTLAESIRSSMSILSEGNLEYALSDLHKESNGNPTEELANEIAAEYGLKGSQLMAAYPKYAETQNNKGPVTPAVDPAKANVKARHDAIQRRNKADADHEQRRAEYAKKQADTKAAFDADHGSEIETARQALDAFKHVEGWKVVDTPDADFQPWFNSNENITIEKDGITITLWPHVEDKNQRGYDAAYPFEIEGHVVFTGADGKKYTYTRRGIDSHTFSAGGRHSGYKELDPAQILADQETRVATSREKGKNMVEVPGTHGIRVAKDKVAAMAANIKAGKSETLMPAGMGIGWELSASKKPYSRPAPGDMKKFFGLDTLFMMQLDAD